MEDLKANADEMSLLEPGEMFGDYTVERLLGKGGMGAVYLLRSPGGDLYAAKVMFPEAAKRHDFRKRFAREAEFAMGLRHENLVSVYDVGEDPETGLCYIIMEYVPGGSLADRIEKSGPMPIKEAVSIAMHVAVALEAAHSRGLVHRDVKPDNILFMEDGTPKLADLGVAKFEDRKTTVTTTGMVIGTPAYMAPEQMMDSRSVDARADIYALGVVLYEMLAGKRPNEGSTAVELLAKAIKGEPLPDVRTMRPETSAAIAHVLSLMCAPDPEKRPPTSLAAAQLLQKAATGRLVLPKKPPRAADAASRKEGRKFPVAACVAGALVLGAVALGWWGLSQRRITQPQSYALPQSHIVMVTNKVDSVIVETNVIDHNGTSVRQGEVEVQGKACPPKQKREIDRRVRCEKVGRYTWFYFVENGDAVIGRGQYGFDNRTRPAIDPMPQGEVVVPRELGGRKVSIIGSQAFFRCEKMTAVVIPQGVVELRPWAFIFCSGLRSVKLPPSLQSMKGGVFERCTNLSEIDIGDCMSFSGYTFRCCPNLSCVTISPTNRSYVSSDGVIYTKDKRELVFYPRTRGAFTIADNVVAIGEGACDSCASLHRVSLSPQITRIGKHAFSFCKGLEEVICEGSLKEIDSYAFKFCPNLGKIIFCANIERVGQELFGGCDNLRFIEFTGDAPTADFTRVPTFGGAADGLEIRVAPGSKGWKTPGSTELPERWPTGGFADTRPIRCKMSSVTTDTPDAMCLLPTEKSQKRNAVKPIRQSDGAVTNKYTAGNPRIAGASSPVKVEVGDDANAGTVEKVRKWVAALVPLLNRRIGGTLKEELRRLGVSIAVGKVKEEALVSPVIRLKAPCGDEELKTLISSLIGLALEGRALKSANETIPTLDYGIALCLAEEVQAELADRGILAEADDENASALRWALGVDSRMKKYDLRGKPGRSVSARRLGGEEERRMARAKVAWIVRELGRNHRDILAAYFRARWEAKGAGQFAGSPSDDDAAVLLSIAADAELFDWFKEHALHFSAKRSTIPIPERIKAKEGLDKPVEVKWN